MEIVYPQKLKAKKSSRAQKREKLEKYARKMAIHLNFSDRDYKILRRISPEISLYFFQLKVVNSQLVAFSTICKFVLQRRLFIYEKVCKNIKFEKLLPWLSLYEKFAEFNLKSFRKSTYKVYKKYRKFLLSDRSFCKKEDLSVILSCPNIFHRFHAILFNMRFPTSLIEFVVELLRGYYKRGLTFNVHSKIKGYLAAIFYLFSFSLNGNYTQSEIAMEFGVSPSVVFNRSKEINFFRRKLE